MPDENAWFIWGYFYSQPERRENREIRRRSAVFYQNERKQLLSNEQVRSHKRKA